MGFSLLKRTEEQQALKWDVCANGDEVIAKGDMSA